jgi:hypothetical protein
MRMIWGHSFGFPSIWASNASIPTKTPTRLSELAWPAAAGMLRVARRFVGMQVLLAKTFGNPQLWPQVIFIIFHFGLTCASLCYFLQLCALALSWVQSQVAGVSVQAPLHAAVSKAGGCSIIFRLVVRYMK